MYKLNKHFKYIFVLLVSLFVRTAFSQGGDFVWARPVGDNMKILRSLVANDDLGNVYVCGVFQHTVDFDPGPAIYSVSADSGNVFLMKLTPNGNLLWVKNFGNAAVRSFTVDGDGDMYIGGYFQNSTDLEPGPGSFTLVSDGSFDGFISKLDSSGNLVWAKTVTGANESYIYGITFDQAGNVYCAGTFNGSVDLDPGPGTSGVLTNGDYDVFITKLNPTGNFIWGHSYGGIIADGALAIKTDIYGACYIIGDFDNIVDFDPGPGTATLSATSGNYYILKLDAAGAYAWAINTKGMLKSLAISEGENVVAGGAFIGSVDFDPGAGTYFLTSQPNALDAFILKLNDTGYFIWAKALNSSSSLNYPEMVLSADISGNIYSAGTYAGITDFDPGPGVYTLTASGWKNAYIGKFNKNGQLIWVQSLYCSSQVDSESLSVDQNKNIYSTGAFNGIIDLDPGPGTFTLAAQPIDINWGSYLLKLADVDDVGVIEYTNADHGLVLFPNPFNEKLNLIGLSDERIDYLLFDCTGRQIISKQNVDFSEGIEVSELLQGLYFILIKSRNNQFLTKIIKK